MKLSAYIYPKPGDGEFETFVASVKTAEEAGYDRVWVYDSQMIWKDPYVFMSHALAATERIAIGTGVTNTFTRHFAVTANVNATLNQIYPGRVLLGIGRGDSSRKTLGLRPVLIDEFKEIVRNIRTLMVGGSLPIVDHTGLAGPETRIVWANEKIPIMIPASGPKSLRLAGSLADIVQLLVGTRPEAIRWALQHVRKGAEESDRDPASIEIGVYTSMFVSDDQEAARQFCRFSPTVTANLLDDLLKHDPDVELPGPLERLIRTPRPPYNYWEGHCESEAPHMALPPEVIDDFSISGSRERCLERIRELAALGVTEIAPGVLNGEIEQMRRVGYEIIPTMRGIEPASWTKALDSLAV